MSRSLTRILPRVRRASAHHVAALAELPGGRRVRVDQPVSRQSIGEEQSNGSAEHSIAPGYSQASSGKSTARVQLRLSRKAVRILKAFSKAGKHPSLIVEKALWRDPSMQDAAAILRLRNSDADS